MLRAMSTAASGMSAQQTRIDAIANNLANVNTVGYKASRMEFQDLLYEEVAPTGGVRADGGTPPTRIEVGHGVRIVSSTRNYSQGMIEQTGNPLDWSVQGDGFFQVSLPDGNVAYTRDGSFKVDVEGSIVTAGGYRLEPAISVPEDAVEVAVGRDGTVSVRLAGDDTNLAVIGQLELARFTNPAGLSQQGENLMRATPNSGNAILGTPAQLGFGTVEQGFVERSNVEVVKELVSMISAQRAYELNSKSIQTADDMLGTVNSIRR